MIVWPFFPNWSSRYVETYEHLTEIITSDSGKEQRRAWRAAARRSVSYEAMVQRDRMQAMRRVLHDRPTGIAFPDEVRRLRLSAAASGQTISLPDVPAWLTPGRYAVFEAPVSRVRVVRTVGNVSGNVVTFGDVQDHVAGTRVMPAFVGTLGGAQRGKIITDGAMSLSVKLDVEPGSEIEDAGFPMTTFRGREVLLHRPDWGQGLELQSDDPTVWTDFLTTARTPYRPVTFSGELLRTRHLLRNADEHNRVVGLFLRSRGRQGEFYAPSWANDITLTAPVAVGATVFRVAGHEFHDAWAADLTRRSFMVRLRSGGLRFFRIASMAKQTAGGVPSTAITVTAPTTDTISPDTVRAISWMPRCRFASDSLSVSWITDQAAEVQVNLHTLEDLP